MNIVIISLNCFPYISPRSNRATELAKEFSRQGHKVTLYALLGDIDYTEFMNETKVTVKNLGTSKYGLVNNEEKKHTSKLVKGLTVLLKRPLHFPKIEAKSLTYNALKAEGHIDLLVTIAQPHPIHWGAAKFREEYPNAITTWIADCGDPFMLNPHFNNPWYFKYVEKKWCKLCDFITIPIEDGRKAYYPEFSSKIKIIPQGFDFENNNLAQYTPNIRPTFGFAGLFYEKLRDPHAFLDYLCTLDSDFKFVIYIKDTPYFRSAFHLNEYKEKLGDKFEIRNFIPRAELLHELSKMDFVINIRNVSTVQQPSKLIDYALSKRPILEITSDFKEQGTFEEFLNGNYTHQTIVENIEQFNIKNVVNNMVALCQDFLKKTL